MHHFIVSVIYNCAQGFWNGKIYADSEPQIQEEHAVFPIYTLCRVCPIGQHVFVDLETAFDRVASYGGAAPQVNWPEMGGLPSGWEEKAQVEEDKYLISHQSKRNIWGFYQSLELIIMEMMPDDVNAIC